MLLHISPARFDCLGLSDSLRLSAVSLVFICGFAASEADPTWIEQIEQQLSRGPDDVLEELGKKLRTLKMPQIGAPSSVL